MWHEFKISLPDELREPVTGALFELGCVGSSDDDGVTVAYFPASEPVETVMAALRGFEGISVEYRPIEDQDWYEPWKKSIGPMSVAGLVICPPWKTPAPKDGEEVVIIDPGQAFGAGEHETTRMCLETIKAWTDSHTGLIDMGVLDVGTGTGILAIAAYRFGFGRVTAVDIETRAVETAGRNLALNGLVGKVKLGPGSVKDAGVGYDLIAANLFLEVLTENIGPIAAALNPGGGVIVSGLLEGQDDEFLLAARAAGLHLVEKRSEGKWVCMLLAAAAPAA